MRLKIILLLSLWPVLMLQSCCRKPDEYLTLPASAYDYIPYDSTSSFTLRDAWGHDNHFTFEQIQREDNVDISCLQCCGQTYDQRYRIIFRGDNPAVALSLGLSHGPGKEDGWTEEPQLQCDLSPDFDHSLVLNDPNCPVDETVECLDSLRVGGQTYWNVIHFGNLSAVSSPDSTTPKMVWYSKTHGLLQVQMMNGKIWELVP